MTKSTVIVWFRQDLRLTDNPALSEAAKAGTILPVYVLDDENAGAHAMGGASRWWLHHALASLAQSLGGGLRLLKGDATQIIPALAAATGAQSVFWNRCYEPWRIARDQHIKAALKAQNIQVLSTNGSLLWEPWSVLKKDGTPYKVFTPFYKNGCSAAPAPRKPLPTPEHLDLWTPSADIKKARHTKFLELADLKLLPTGIRWDAQLENTWQAMSPTDKKAAYNTKAEVEDSTQYSEKCVAVDEQAAQSQLEFFLTNSLKKYSDARDFPSENAISRLSPYLHFGALSPNQVWYAAHRRKNPDAVNAFCRQLAWREFCYHLLYANPNMPGTSLQKKFESFPWRKDKRALISWQQGKTGIPIVDAGMRELWQTGLMHNRVRMVVGSFLVKNLLLDWRLGQAWFWDCLVDADLANNSAGWQWVAGCGADAAPYFRVFNPVTQAQKFDKQGRYIRQYIPEIASLPDKYLAAPWLAPAAILKSAGITLGKTYPKPIVDLKSSRIRALEALKTLTS